MGFALDRRGELVVAVERRESGPGLPLSYWAHGLRERQTRTLDGITEAGSLQESLDEAERGVGDIGPAVIEDQGVPPVRDLDIFGHFGVFELLFVAALGERDRGGGVVGAGDNQQWPPVGVLHIYSGVPTEREVGQTRLEQRDSGPRHMVAVIQLAGLSF